MAVTVQRLIEAGKRGLAPIREIRELRLELARRESHELVVNERIAELELSLEQQGWTRYSQNDVNEFTREGLRAIVDQARTMAIKNPLIARAVEVERTYVWGLGWNIKAEDPTVNTVIQEFLDDRGNRTAVTGQQARELLNDELKYAGNLFFVFFVNSSTGFVRIRTFPVEEISEIIRDPEDASANWLYKRHWTERVWDWRSGSFKDEQRTTYYPDWQYRPADQPATIGSDEVAWDRPIYQKRVGGMNGMRFGVPEVYAALDWARAAKDHLEDWAAVWRALNRFALALKTQRRAGVDAGKARLGTTIASGAAPSYIETNPYPIAGSTFISTDGADLQAFRAAGARPSPEEARRLWLMVCSAVGLPETFFGDANAGNFATATTLDRPTELRMRNRQAFWIETFGDIFAYVVEQSVRAPSGKLQGRTFENDAGDEQVELDPLEGTDEPASLHVNITFPDILERDVKARVEAVVSAATLDGKPNANIFPMRRLVEFLLQAMGVDDVDEELDEMFPETQNGLPIVDPANDPAMMAPGLTDPNAVGADPAFATPADAALGLAAALRESPHVTTALAALLEMRNGRP